MRAGSLDRIVTLDAYTAGEPDDYGVSQPAWQHFARVSAQLVTLSTEEFLRSAGETNDAMIVLRIRFLPGVTNAHRVTFEGRQYDIQEMKEIGRREALELRCRERRA